MKVSGLYDVAHGAGLTALWGSWARYVYKDCLPRFCRFALHVMNVPEIGSDEAIALKGIEALEAFFASLSMPISLKELGLSFQMRIFAHWHACAAIPQRMPWDRQKCFMKKICTQFIKRPMNAPKAR